MRRLERSDQTVHEQRPAAIDELRLAHQIALPVVQIQTHFFLQFAAQTRHRGLLLVDFAPRKHKRVTSSVLDNEEPLRRIIHENAAYAEHVAQCNVLFLLGLFKIANQMAQRGQRLQHRLIKQVAVLLQRVTPVHRISSSKRTMMNVAEMILVIPMALFHLTAQIPLFTPLLASAVLCPMTSYEHTSL